MMGEQDGRHVSAWQRPNTNNPEAWKAYWEAQGQQWRTEPEIDIERQKYLAERQSIKPDIEQGIYPFKEIKLSRADIEALLATHENGRGPVDWSDESQREREGLDLRGADLRRADLHELPLACLCGGLTGSIWDHSSPEQDRMAAVQMESAILIRTHLEGAKLNQASLKRANLFRVYLEGAELCYADISEAFLNEAHLGGTNLKGACLEGTYPPQTQ